MRESGLLDDPQMGARLGKKEGEDRLVGPECRLDLGHRDRLDVPYLSVAWILQSSREPDLFELGLVLGNGKLELGS